MEKLCGKIRAALEKYDMIDDGDVISVGVSGGKDSLVLLYCMAMLSRYYPKRFTLKAVTCDPCFNGNETDFSGVQALCDKLGVEYIIRRTSLGEIIFNERKEKNPCSLCAKMRRGILHRESKENGCNKIALGHNADDAVQTFIMNIFECGSIGCFSPKTYLSNRDLWMIRPMIFCGESEILSAAVRHELPVVKSLCPADGNTQRSETANLIDNLARTYPDIKAKLMGAMQRGDVSGWGTGKNE